MIILYFDDRFFKWAQLLIESIGIHEPTEKILVFEYNLPPSQRKKILTFRNTAQLVRIKKETPFKIIERPSKRLKTPDTTTYRKNGARALLMRRKAWYVEEAFKKFPKESLYLVIDTDMLLVKPLTAFKNQMKQNDLAGAFSEGSFLDGSKKVKIGGGFLAFKPTKMIKALLGEWDAVLKRDWTENQISLGEIYQRYEKTIKFLQIDKRKYMDPRSMGDSILWSAHKGKFGKKKERFEVYLTELQKMKFLKKMNKQKMKAWKKINEQRNLSKQERYIPPRKIKK